MGDLVDLNKFKEKKQQGEMDDLRETLDAIMDELELINEIEAKYFEPRPVDQEFTEILIMLNDAALKLDRLGCTKLADRLVDLTGEVGEHWNDINGGWSRDGSEE
jgi:hypothetical protein